MRLSRDAYYGARSTLAAFGNVVEHDYFPGGDPPYRYASMEIAVESDADVVELVTQLLPRMKPFGLHLNIWTHYGDGKPRIELSWTRHLTEDEIGDAPVASRPVP